MIPKLLGKIKKYVNGKILKAKDDYLKWKWKRKPPKPSPKVVNQYFAWKMPDKCATIVNNLGYSPATAEQKYMSGNPGMMNFDPFPACEFLIQSGHLPIIAIFKQWFEKSDDFQVKCPPPAKVKPKIIMGLWLTKPPFEEHMEKITQVANLLAHPTMTELLGTMLGDWPPDTIIAFIEKVGVPTLGGGLEKGLPVGAAVPVFMQLKKKNPARFGALLGSLPGEYKGGIMKEIGAKEAAAKEGEKNATLWGKEVNRIEMEKSVGVILNKIKDRVVGDPPPKDNPGEGEGKAEGK